MLRLPDAADENLVVHAGWVQRHVAGMRVVEDEALVIIDSGLACDTFNYVLRARLNRDSAANRVHGAIGYFRDAGRPFSWWVGPADQPGDLGRLLIDAGLEQAETELAMAADVSTVADVDLSPVGLRIERVRTAVQLRHFAALNAANWTPPDSNVLEFYARASNVLLSDRCPLWFYVGYVDDVPVATSERTVGGGVAGLYNISTAAAHRRRGIGTAMTAQPLVDARAAGLPTGILQAAAEGVGVYQRVGFRPFGQITEYKPKPTGHSG